MLPGGGGSSRASDGPMRPGTSPSSSASRLPWSVATTTRAVPVASVRSHSPIWSERPGSGGAGAYAALCSAPSSSRSAPRSSRTVSVSEAMYGGCQWGGSSPLPTSCASPVGCPAVRFRGVGAQLIDIGQDQVAVGRQVVRGRARGQVADPGLRGFADVPGLQPGEIGLERVAELAEVPHLGDDRITQILRRGNGELAGGQQLDLLPTGPAGLGGGIEDPDGVHLVAELLDPDGVRLAGRPQVDQAPTNRELADPGHLGRGVVPGGHQTIGQLALRDAITDPHPASGAPQPLHGQRPLPQRGQRGHDHEIPLRAGQAGEDRQPRGRLVAIRQRPLEGQRPTLGQDRDGVGIQPRPQVVRQAVGLLIGLDHDHERARPLQGCPTRGHMRRPSGRRHVELDRRGRRLPEQRDQRPEPRTAGHGGEAVRPGRPR